MLPLSERNGVRVDVDAGDALGSSGGEDADSVAAAAGRVQYISATRQLSRPAVTAKMLRCDQQIVS
jgi:hypothetical protein